MAKSQFVCFLVSEMESVAFAVFEEFAIFADARLCPAAVAHDLVFVLPNFGKVILVNVALDESVSQVGAGRYATVH